MDIKHISKSDFAGKFKGKLGFVIGAGPSLCDIKEPEKLLDYVTFTVNSGIMKLPNCDYFVSDDRAVKEWTYYPKYIVKSTCEKLLYRVKWENETSELDENKTFFFEHKIWHFPKTGKVSPEGLLMTEDPSLPIIGARSSVGTAIHLAHIAGCDPIVLLGIDCKMGDDKRRYFWQYPDEPKQYPDEPKQYPDEPKQYPDEPKTKRLVNKARSITFGFSEEEFLTYFSSLAKESKRQGVRVIDITTGHDKGFEIMTLEEVFEQFGDRSK